MNIRFELPLPIATKLPVVVHHNSSKGLASSVIQMSQAVRFDSLLVSTVREITNSLSPPHISPTSGKNCARWIYHNIKATANTYFLAPLRFDQPLLDTRHAEPGNIAHLLINILPYCLLAQEKVDPDTIMVFRKMAPIYESLVRYFNISPAIDSRRLAGDIVKIRGTRGLAVYDSIETDEVWPTAFLPDPYERFDFSGMTEYPKIFLARRGDRALINHDAAAHLVRRFGYRTIFMEDFSIEKQLKIGANAKRVIAIHGAAMAFLVMAKQIESVIELMPNHTYGEYFPVSLGTRVIHYEQIISSFDETIVQQGWNTLVRHKMQPFAVDLALLEQRLKLLN